MNPARDAPPLADAGQMPLQALRGGDAVGPDKVDYRRQQQANGSVAGKRKLEGVWPVLNC